MGLLNLIKRKAPSRVEQRSLPFGEGELLQGLTMLANYGGSVGGVSVTPDNAMQAASVLACVGRVAKDLSTLPIRVVDQNNKRVNHPVVRLLRQPNEYMTGVSMWQSFVLNLLLWGNGYLAIEKQGEKPTALLPMKACHTWPRRRAGRLVYFTSPTGRPKPLGADQVIHAPYLPFDGACGQGPIQLAAKTVGVTIALSDFAARYFDQGSFLDQNAFELPAMSTEALQQTKKLLEDQYGGAENQHKRLAMPGLKVHKLYHSMRESQALESRDFQLREVCRIFGVPVGIVDPEKSKYAGLEAMYQDYQQATLRPIAVGIEAELDRKLLSEADRDRYRIEFNLDAIVRASLADRMEADTKGVQASILTPNEARDHHRLPPIKGGDKLLSPLNMTPAEGRSAALSEEDQEAADQGAQESRDDRVTRLIGSIAEGIATKEANAARRAAKTPDQFHAWADDWFCQHRAHLAQRLPVIDPDQAKTMADQARDVMLEAHVAGGDELMTLLDGWLDRRTEQILRVAA